VSDLTPFDLFVVILSQSFVLLTLVGLVVRRHITTCPTFGLYLLVVFATDSLMLFESYDRMSFWLMKEIALNVLKFLVALELISRAFAAFPGAKATAYRVMGLVMGLTLLVVVWLAAGWRPEAWLISDRAAATLIVSEFHTRIITGTTLLFVSIAALILWYRLPVESMQKAILIGFVPYLIFFYMTLELQTANLWPKGGWLARLGALAWPVLLGYWAHAAWQPFRESIPRGGPPLAMIHGTAR
jgi:hypothetical protein